MQGLRSIGYLIAAASLVSVCVYLYNQDMLAIAIVVVLFIGWSERGSNAPDNH